MELEDTGEQNEKMLKGNLIRDEAFSFALQVMGLAKTLSLCRLAERRRVNRSVECKHIVQDAGSPWSQPRSH